MSKDRKPTPSKPLKENSGDRSRGEGNNPANRQKSFNDQNTTTSTGPKSPENKK